MLVVPNHVDKWELLRGWDKFGLYLAYDKSRNVLIIGTHGDIDGEINNLLSIEMFIRAHPNHDYIITCCHPISCQVQNPHIVHLIHVPEPNFDGVITASFCNDKIEIMIKEEFERINRT